MAELIVAFLAALTLSFTVSAAPITSTVQPSPIASLPASLVEVVESAIGRTAEFCQHEAGTGDLLLAQSGCCRVCRTGKACGNSCINRSLTCHQPRGCACDG